MKWIKGAPKKVGWYWLRFKYDYSNRSETLDVIMSIQYFEGRSANRSVVDYTGCKHKIKNIIAHCPIEEPEE